MYFVILFVTAFFLISIFSTNWPIKLYHYLLLKNLARELNTEPQRHGLLLSNVYSEIISIFQGKEFRIRFTENSIDSIRSNSGLEIRMSENTGVVMEFYRANRKKRVWGDFRQYRTGDCRIDSEWFILTTDLEKAGQLWSRTQLRDLIKDFPQLEQILINKQEIIIQLKNYHSGKAVLNVLQRLASI
ncbi:MAG: hypothetical protein ACM3YE_02950 [Bacteroidota bacterium]